MCVLFFWGSSIGRAKRRWISIHPKIKSNTTHLCPWEFFCKRVVLIPKLFKIFRKRENVEIQSKMKFKLIEDSLQQNHTLKYFGKGYYWGPFLGFCFLKVYFKPFFKRVDALADPNAEGGWGMILL